MSWIDKRQRATVRHLEDLFDLPPPGPEVTFGAEDERFYLRTDGSIATPEDTQAFLRARLALGGEADWELPGEGPPRIARVREERATWSLEAAGVLELATRPFPLSQLRRFGPELQELLAERDRAMAVLGLRSCPFSAPPSLSTAQAEQAMVHSARLRTLYRKFLSLSPEHPARFTMLQEAVAQISLAPRSLAQAGTLMRRALQWAPLLYAATDNSCGFLRAERSSLSVRSREWARHNAFVPPGRERAGVPAVLLDLALGAPEESFVERYLSHVAQVPLVFHYGEDGRERYDSEPCFHELAARGLGRVDNAALALSLCWFDARLSPLRTEHCRWLRVEVRSPDGGSPASTWLAALLVCGALVPEHAGTQADELFASCKVDREGYLAARSALPEQGLHTPFGNTRLRELLPRLCAIALESCERLGVAPEQLAPLQQLMERSESPAEQHRRGLSTLQQAEAAALARGTPQLP